MTSFFYVKECPEKETCSDAAWSRAKVWGWTEQEARERLISHLTSSGLHQMMLEEATALADLCELEEEPWTEPQPKKPRMAPGQAKGSSKGSGGGGSSCSSEQVMQQLATMLSAGIQQPHKTFSIHDLDLESQTSP